MYHGKYKAFGMLSLAAVLACLFCLTAGAAMRAEAAVSGKASDFNGMRVTIAKPWELLTHDSEGVTLKEGLGFMLADEEGIPGEGWAEVYPLKKGHSFPAPEKLKGMSAKELGDLIRGLHTTYMEFPAKEEAESPALTESNGFTAVVSRWKSAPAEESKKPGYAIHNVAYYFFLKDRLVYLHASVYGDEATNKQLEGICASFVPDAKARQAGSK